MSLCPNTGAETITPVVKDILLRCTLPIEDKHTMEQLERRED